MRHQLAEDIAESVEFEEDTRKRYYITELPEEILEKISSTTMDEKHSHLNQLMEEDRYSRVRQDKIKKFTPTMRKMAELVESGQAPVYRIVEINEED